MKRVAYLYILVLVVTSIFLSASKGPAQSLSWDAMGYNAYYSIALDDAQDLQYFKAINSKYDNCEVLYQFHETDSTFYVKYSMGWAVMYSPFIMTGHLWAKNSDEPADFYSKPYQVAAYIGTFVFLFLAWVLTWKSLRYYFDARSSFVGLVMTSLGSSYFFYSYQGLGMNHHVQFFLVSLLVLYTIKFIHTQKGKYIITIGLALGLIGLVRIPDLLFAVFPLTLIVQHFGLKRLFEHEFIKHTLLAFLIGIVVLSLQLFYWKYTTGSWFLNSYADNPGEGLELWSTTVFSFLFSYRSGLIPYFPFYLLAVVGWVFVYKKHKKLAISGALTTVIFIYIVGSWSAYWYAPRAVLEGLPLFAFGATAFFSMSRKKVLAGSSMTLVLVFSLFKTWQITNYVIPQLRMTQDAYWATFLRTQPLKGNEALLYRPYNNHFSQTEMNMWKQVYEKTFHHTQDFDNHLVLHPKNQFSKEIVVDQNAIEHPDDLIVHTKLLLDTSQKHISDDLLICISMKHEGEVYHWRAASVQNEYSIFNNSTLQWNHYLPEPRSAEDTYHIGLWLNNKTDTVKIQYFEVSMYNRK